MVSVSLINAVAEADGIVTWKSVAFRLAMEFRLMPLPDDDEEVVVVPVVVVVGVVVLMLGCSATVTLVGGLMPRVCALSRLTCMTAISINTSGFDLSRSSTSFCASAIWSGVPRTTIAPCEGNC